MAGTTVVTDVWQERAVRAGGVRTRFLEAGDPGNPTVVLLHDGAWGGSSDVTWGSCMPLLARRFHVIAPDFLGYGGSDKATFFDRSSYDPRIAQIEALLEALLIEAPHVVGSSYGGSVALRMAAETRTPLRSAVSIGGSGGPWKTEVLLRELGRWDGTRDDLARVLALLMDESHPLFAEQLALRHRWASAPGHYRAVASATIELPDPLRTRIEDPWPGPLVQARTPILLVAGRHDRLFEPDWADRLKAVATAAEIVALDSRHSPNLDHPAELVDVITAFLDRTAAGLDSVRGTGELSSRPSPRPHAGRTRWNR